MCISKLFCLYSYNTSTYFHIKTSYKNDSFLRFLHFITHYYKFHWILDCLRVDCEFGNLAWSVGVVVVGAKFTIIALHRARGLSVTLCVSKVFVVVRRVVSVSWRRSAFLNGPVNCLVSAKRPSHPDHHHPSHAMQCYTLLHSSQLNS
jgi:hypothetical protein